MGYGFMPASKRTACCRQMRNMAPAMHRRLYLKWGSVAAAVIAGIGMFCRMVGRTGTRWGQVVAC